MMPEGARVPETEATEVSAQPSTDHVRKRPSLAAWARLRFILEGTPPHAVELVNALSLVSWGGWLIAVPGAFASDPLLYAGMGVIASETWWGTVVVALGLFSLAVLLLDGRGGRAAVALAQFFVWLLLMLLLGEPTGFQSTVVPVYLTHGVAAGWVYIRLERDRRRIG